MAKKYSPADNLYNGNAPWVWTGGAKEKAGQMFDPFNIWGWDKTTPNFGIAQPDHPGYQAGFDPFTMSMAPEVAARLEELALDTRGLEKFRREALRSGPSPWAELMSNKNFAEEAAGRDRARNVGASARAQAESELAMKGGLSSGARERLARKGATDVLAMDQDISRQGNLNRMQIGINDEQNRIGRLAQLPGMEKMAFDANQEKEQMWENARQSDIQRIVNENNQRNQFNQNLYAQKMAAWAAERQAFATENSGKSGLFK